jgi:hypothetical protein
MATSEWLKSTYNYLIPIYWLEKFSKQDTTNTKESIKSLTDTFESFIGIFNRDSKSLPDSISLPNHYVVVKDVRAAIFKEAARHQVVMLNEDHLDPYGRFFAKSLLDSLWNLGYRYLAAETLLHNPGLNNQTFVTQKAGFYSSEPCFGDFLRRARQLGFRLVPYENDHPCDCTDRICRINCRERNQASYLAQIFKTDPQAKVFVYAGHGHIYKKSSNPNMKFMAEYFRDSTGIEPFCIDQSRWVNTPKDKVEDATASLTLVDPHADKYWVRPKIAGAVDMEIIHPPTKYVDNYPDFLTHKGSHPVPINLNGGSYKDALLQVFIYPEQEEHLSIPLINLRLQDKNSFYIYLPSGKFLLRVIDRYNVHLHQNIFTIK